MNSMPANPRTQTDPGSIETAISAAKSGDYPRARALLLKIVEQDERNAQAWLWLSSVTDNLEDVKICLENILSIDPQNEMVRERLEWLKKSSPEPDQTEKIEPVEPSASNLPDNSPENLNIRQRFTCPTCGGLMRFNPVLLGLQCSYCGHIEEVKEKPFQPEAEALERVSGTRRAYTRAESERLLRCQQCGAVSFFPPAQISLACPYCGGPVFAVTNEDTRLEWPQALIPMQMEALTAQKKALEWLRGSFFNPSGLHNSILQKLSPLYMPVWLITAAISFSDPGNTSLLGKLDFLYTDWVVPGIHHPAAKFISALKPFKWQDLVEFRPEYLASWPAFVCETSIASASQQACNEIRNDAQHRLPAGIHSAGSFFCQSYRLALFPVWICTYAYKNKTYHLVVSGQTGQVAGDRPLDLNRVYLAIASALVVLGFLVIGASNLLKNTWQVMAPPILNVLAIFKPVGLLLFLPVILLVILVVVILRS